MVETDWREILSFSQKELTQTDKEKLCESLCWMEADDIELNFTDLKTLFRLAQDILKLKSEQVNNLVGQLKSSQKKSGKMKAESTYAVSPTQSNDSALETITHQEEIIKANKEILEQLYADIADLESRKSRLEESRSNFDIDSDSSRDVLSELNAVAELEQEVTMKNKHIRKLLNDVKILEEENTNLKEKVSILKDKLTEATQLIDNLTEQIMAVNNECGQLKELLGKSEQAKAHLSVEMEGLRKEVFEKDSKKENLYEDIKSKVQHWKKSDAEKRKIKELQDKLTEASNEIEQTANLINLLRAENKQLKAVIEELPDNSVSEAKNISDDNKERTIINKLKRKVKSLTVSLQGAEEMVAAREKELTEITSQLQLLQSDEGINALLEGLKNKKRQLKFKDEGIKTLVQEANTLNNMINDLQLENETLRQRFNVPSDEKVPVKGIMKDYRNLQETNAKITKELKRLENKLVGTELSNRQLNTKIKKLVSVLNKAGYTKNKIDEIVEDSESDENQPKLEKEEVTCTITEFDFQQLVTEKQNQEKEMLTIIEENKGLRKGLQEILDFLKDNSKTSSGILTLQCPSLEAILLSMEARNSAGWFAPHMSTVMELRTALGGKDALLTALHEARKETFDVMAQLSDATKKSSELEKRLNEIEVKNREKEAEEKLLQQKNDDIEFGSWMSEKEQNDIDFCDKSQIDRLVEKGNSLYECQLKKGLEYFHIKFKELFDKLTCMAIQASDDLNKWSIQEENYKAQIERLKTQLQEDDSSDHSPGIVPIPSITCLERKCIYLEEAYKYIRTLNENLKNEILEKEYAQKIESNVEQMVLDKQIKQLCTELDDKNKKITSLELKNAELQEVRVKNIDETLASLTKQEANLMKEQLNNLSDENVLLKEKCQHISSQLDVALLQLQDNQQRQLSNDLEINMLQHQILDLQSTSDNKAIIARLSGEILVAHLQASESHKKLERLQTALNKERELRIQAEDMFRARQKIFDVYATRYESKFRYLYEILTTLRQQYQGSVPLTSIEKYLNKIEELSRKNRAVDEKLYEIDDLRANLISKHAVFDQILDVSKNKCSIGEDSCPHKLKYIMMQSVNTREIEHINKKLKAMERSQEDLMKHCNNLERTLVLLNQGFEKTTNDQHRSSGEDTDDQSVQMELEDVQSEDESSPRRSQTITLSKPQILQTTTNQEKETAGKQPENKKPDSPAKVFQRQPSKTFTDSLTQTDEIVNTNKLIQTDENNDVINKMRDQIESLTAEINDTSKQLYEAMSLTHKRTEEILALNNEKVTYETKLQSLKESSNQKDIVNDKLQSTVNDLKNQIIDLQKKLSAEANQKRENANEENKSLLLALKQLEDDKNSIIVEYKGLLNNERDEYAKSVKDLQLKIVELQSNLDRRASESSASNGEALKEVVTKYTMKTSELEDKCFKLQSELDECKSELTTYQSESARWKDLATERLTKMEQLNSQLEERHCHEVKSYKAENEHWLTQLNEMQREHMDLRTRLTDQKTVYLKQLSDKDTQIEQLRIIINNLRTQIMNMQTLISVNDPSFDLSAIVEVDETSDVLSHRDSERLELKFESSVDLHDSHDDVMRIPASSTTIWQEPVIERLRREKQLVGKQNAILRRQIKVLASKERRARLDAQNLKNQVFRISTTGHKVTTAETVALHNKIASLQAQLTSARRETNSSVALWDKWKRAQQASDRWQSRYEDKCQEVTKLEAGLSLAKSSVARLEKEKRVLLTRLNEAKHDSQIIAIEKQEAETQEKPERCSKECMCSEAALPVSSQALLDRVQAQQRRIAALEIAEKGNELLVAEYERSLAEITSLKGQVLKLESTILESQIRTPLKSGGDAQPELNYWKKYAKCKPYVLYLKTGRHQSESHRLEVANLKRTIHDKDLLLERSKEMLKIAAEREDELLREVRGK
ncbi:hypothetical protein HF086_015475 [Spodoptera exigua]|uniref:Uncharacterized protein n=1 Tax=Spodoptera exigua TaxID=7107 RepID=A0A922MFF5_SPOEX|nr:hypothetical protein HF086_015475 [Spodoptera exigua]